MAVSLSTALPTTPPVLALVMIAGLAWIMVAISLTPLSLAVLLLLSPLYVADQW